VPQHIDPRLPAAPVPVHLDFLGAAALVAIMPRLRHPEAWVAPIRTACARFQITSVLRVASFLSQVGHESADLTELSESLNYSAASLLRMWPSRFSPELAQKVGRTADHPANEAAIAEIAYGNRMGNAVAGDAWAHRGAGAIQLTGWAMHDSFARWAEIATDEVPDYLRTPDGALLSAAWYWDGRGLNRLADAGQNDEISRRINGAATVAGTNGIADRRARYARALAAFAPLV
jgi:putative chitinase